jgi:hypothetical protein
MEKLNGYKTLIGGIILVLTGLNIASEEEVMTIVEQISLIVGSVFVAVGLCHKIYKRFKEQKND